MLDFTFTLSHETTALLLFASMGLLMLTGQRVFAEDGQFDPARELLREARARDHDWLVFGEGGAVHVVDGLVVGGVKLFDRAGLPVDRRLGEGGDGGIEPRRVGAAQLDGAVGARSGHCTPA